MPSATTSDTLPASAPEVRQATLTFGALSAPVRVVKIEQGTVDLVVPRTARLVVGDQLTLTLEGDPSALEGLVVSAVCDTRRMPGTGESPFPEALSESSDGSLWVRCSAETPKARATLWALSPAGSLEAPQPEVRGARRDRLPAHGLDGESARLERLAHLRSRTGKPLESLSHTRLIADHLRHNIEHLVGSVEVPVGAAGPLLFKGREARDSIYLPMATTEGALVASTTRGAMALTLAGGVRTRVMSQTMHRVPTFTFHSMDQACRFARWLEDHASEVRQHAERVSRHARLVELSTTIIGRAVHARFVYETGDAAGQNMTTACTWNACQWILEHIPHLPDLQLDIFAIEGGMSTDKKASYASLVRGRGVRVAAEAYLDASVLRRVLKVTPEQLVRGHATGMAGALQAGELGYNINVANVIAAVFTAAGQDIACVHESALGMLQLELEPGGGLYASMVLPSLIVGTVGGGTNLPQQRDYLEMMGCAGAGGVRRLAEIVAGYCLALDLSTLSAVVSGQFATAHERLGRNRPVAWLREGDFDAEFFGKHLDATKDGELKVTKVEKSTADVGSSIITNLTASRNTGKFVGFLPRKLELTSVTGHRTSIDTLVKVKPLDDEALTVMRTVASVCGEEVAKAARRHEKALGFSGCHKRELGVYRQTDPRFTKHVPAVYGTYEDPSREAYVLMIERLQGLRLMDSAEDISGFTQADLEAIVRGLSDLHSVWLGREMELKETDWLGTPPSSETMTAARDFWIMLADHAHQEFPEWVDERAHQRWRETIDAMASYWPELEAMPRTLVHNDFNPRNFGLRDEHGERRLCAYDWELATLHVPQRDLAELLAFTLDPQFHKSDVLALVEQHRAELEEKSGITLPRAQWRRGFVLALRDFLVTRISIYVMGHTCRDYRFLPRTFRTLKRLLEIFDDEIMVHRPMPSDSISIP